MRKYTLLRSMYRTLYALRALFIFASMVILYAVVGCVLGISYLFLAGEGLPETVDKLLITAVVVLPFWGGLLLFIALKVHELWECLHRDRYAWATMFLLLLGYTFLPVMLNVLSIVLGALGALNLSVSVFNYRYRALGIAGCFALLLVGIQMYRCWKQEQQSKKRMKRMQVM